MLPLGPWHNDTEDMPLPERSVSDFYNTSFSFLSLLSEKKKKKEKR